MFRLKKFQQLSTKIHLLGIQRGKVIFPRLTPETKISSILVGIYYVN